MHQSSAYCREGNSIITKRWSANESSRSVLWPPRTRKVPWYFFPKHPRDFDKNFTSSWIVYAYISYHVGLWHLSIPEPCGEDNKQFKVEDYTRVFFWEFSPRLVLADVFRFRGSSILFTVYSEIRSTVSRDGCPTMATRDISVNKKLSEGKKCREIDDESLGGFRPVCLWIA